MAVLFLIQGTYMNIAQTLRSKTNGIAFVSIYLLLALTMVLGVEVYRLSVEINTVSRKVSETNQTVTCPQLWNDGSTGRQYCTSVNDQLNTITDTLNKVQDTVNNICTPNVVGC